MSKFNIGFVPGSPTLNNNEIFNPNNEFNTDDRFAPYIMLKNYLNKNNINLNTLDTYDDISNLDLVILQSVNFKVLRECIKNNLLGKIILQVIEPPSIHIRNSTKNLYMYKSFFKYILTWNDDLIDNEHFRKYNYATFFKDYTSEKVESLKLLTSISGNKSSTYKNELYSKRFDVIQYFENNYSEAFDFYGRGWDKSLYKNYKGEVNSKFKIYQQYKFALCFENICNIKGYITEKIFDCFKSNIVPVYWGASNIAEYIPENCFIDYRKFNNPQSLYDHLIGISESDYIIYLENIKSFMNSDKITRFTVDYYAANIYKIVRLALSDNVIVSKVKNKTQLLKLELLYLIYRIKKKLKLTYK